MYYIFEEKVSYNCTIFTTVMSKTKQNFLIKLITFQRYFFKKLWVHLYVCVCKNIQWEGNIMILWNVFFLIGRFPDDIHFPFWSTYNFWILNMYIYVYIHVHKHTHTYIILIYMIFKKVRYLLYTLPFLV